MKLEGVRVLDLSLFLPGPLLTQMMADHGAEVIKLEPVRGGGEPNREIGPKRDGVSVYFANTHRGKRSVQLDLKNNAGRELALAMDRYKLQNHRRYITCDEMLSVMAELGYQKRDSDSQS